MAIKTKLRNAKPPKMRRCHDQGIIKKKKLINSKINKIRASGNQR